MLNLIELNASGEICLVLIHGTAGSPHSTWERFVSHLNGAYRVLAVDLSRLEQASAATQTVTELGRLIARQIQERAVEGVHLIGYSLGAALAIEVASVVPRHILTLSLIAPFDNARDPLVRSTFEHWHRLLEKNPRELATNIISQGFSAAWCRAMGPAQVAVYSEAFYLRVHWPGVVVQLALNLSLDVASQVPRIQCPTAVIIGLDDRLVPVRVSVALYRRLANGSLFSLPCGHLLTAEDPQGLAQIVQSFIALFAAAPTAPDCL
ncbi:alpha/beta fold hydrolase [Pseudomonas sp. NFACC39-1]|uniref:alpha/beta fold hydrolase n=1 Tax=Pseudomonas sp. NFACC39-1 TaxID=1566195 RepID=UPI0008C739F0|nr:alpha/beta hydrolase [Pseudomonas sp. NFACC39-1]SEO08077.1 Pimeloyl-ACP methyl ester carboxylesterase [Pseudomonas sp. NFACC39-1]